VIETRGVKENNSVVWWPWSVGESYVTHNTGF